MSVFGESYARYYALLYRDKDYAGEARFVADLLRRHAPAARSLVEFGCGGGKHAALLAADGFAVTGIDRSEDMLVEARAHATRQASDTAARLRFRQGDFTQVRLGEQFDCAVSLFHVVSYMPDNAALAAALATARAHLVTGGVFLFDVWHGPAVLTERPSTRIKRMADETTEVTRLCESTLHPNDCLVDVHYQVFVRDRASGTVEELQETHRMRYLFPPEIALFASQAGFAVEHSCQWMAAGEAPDEHNWGACYLLRAV